MSQLTLEQEKIFDRVNDAIEADNIAEATRLMKQLPLQPERVYYAARMSLSFTKS
jgi:hypothetical protein